MNLPLAAGYAPPPFSSGGMAHAKTNNLSACFRNFLNNDKLSDVTFIIQNQKLFAHKLVLAARSPYFNQLILVSCKNTNTLEIEIQDASAAIFYSVMEYMYTDSTVLKQESVWDVYQAAKFYQIFDLMLTCEEFIISTLNEANVFDNWKKSQQFGANALMEHCAVFVRTRYHNELQKLNINPSAIEVNSSPEIISHAIKSIDMITKQGTPTPPGVPVTPQVSAQVQTPQFQHPQPMMPPAAPPAQAPTGTEKPKDEIYNSLNTYSFPLSGTPVPPKEEEEEQLDDEGSDEEIENGYLKPDSTPVYTQTFELWGNHNLPPAAFPTPESMAAFPQFFRVEGSENNVAATNGTTPGIVQKELKSAQPTTSTAASSSESRKSRQSQIMTRRMSVIADPSVTGMFCQYMISSITKLVDAERTSLFLYDRASDELCSQVAVGETEIRIPSNKGIAGSVFQSGKSVNVTDAYTNSSFASDVDKSTGFTTRYVLCSPIMGKDSKVVGVIEVLNKQSGPFNEEDEQHLRTVSALISIFISEHMDDEQKSLDALAKQVYLLNPSSYRRPTKQGEDLFSLFDDMEDISELLAGQSDQLLLPNGAENMFASRGSSFSMLSNASQHNLANGTRPSVSRQLHQHAPQPVPVQQLATQQIPQPQSQLPPPPPQQQQQQQQQQPQPQQSMTSLLNMTTDNRFISQQQQQQMLQQMQQMSMQQQQQQQVSLMTQPLSPQVSSQYMQAMNFQPQNPGMFPSPHQQPQQMVATPQYATPSSSAPSPAPRGNAVTFNDASFINESNNFASPKSTPSGSQSSSPVPVSSRGKKKQQSSTAIGKKRKRDNMPFMHFRIPRYELQFIQFDAAGMKKK